jgi:hypothetical protein
MEVSTNIDLISGVYHAQVSVVKLTEAEKEALAKFGEPLVEVGGLINKFIIRPAALASTLVTLDLPKEQRRMTSQFPVKRVFDTADNVDADIQAQAWLIYVKENLFFARAGLMLRADTFLGKNVESQTGPSTYSMTEATITVDTAIDESPLSGATAGTLIGEPVLFTITGAGGAGVYSYNWYIVSGPSALASQLTGQNTATVTFTPNSLGVYELAGVVMDPVINAPAQVVTVEVIEIPFVVDAGSNQTVDDTDTVSLLGIVAHDGSYNAGTKTYAWSVTAGPDTSGSQFSSTTTLASVFTPAIAGSYTLQLEVVDSMWGSKVDTLFITVNPT